MSGIIASVHTFGQSVTAPYYIDYMIVVLAATLVLIAWKYNTIQSKKIFESFLSRESSFLYNNWIFIASAASVLWGTTYPLLSEAFRGYKVMVGPGFYNQINVPLGIALLFLMAICPLIAWRRASVSNLKRNFTKSFAAAVLAVIITFSLGIRDFYAQIAVAGSVLVVSTHLLDVSRIINRQKKLEDNGLLKNFGKALSNTGDWMFKIMILFILISGLFSINPAMADEDMTSHLICPCECAMVISTCDCATAAEVKKEIAQMKENGFSEMQIFSALQTEYGKEILAHPEKVNSIPVWVPGISVAFISVFLGFILIRKKNQDVIPVPEREKYEKQFEEEYRKFVSEMEEK